MAASELWEWGCADPRLASAEGAHFAPFAVTPALRVALLAVAGAGPAAQRCGVPLARDAAATNASLEAVSRMWAEYLPASELSVRPQIRERGAIEVLDVGDRQLQHVAELLAAGRIERTRQRARRGELRQLVLRLVSVGRRALAVHRIGAAQQLAGVASEQ